MVGDPPAACGFDVRREDLRNYVWLTTRGAGMTDEIHDDLLGVEAVLVGARQ